MSGSTASTRPEICVGIVGTGRVAETHARCLARIQGAPLVAIADVDEKARTVFGDTFGVEARYQSAEEFFAHPQMDAVFICVPPAQHGSLTIRALEAGKHVFVEKPMVAAAEELGEVVAAAQRHRRWVQVGHVTRFDRELLYLRRLVGEGRLGRVYRARVRSFSRFVPSGWHALRCVAGGGILVDCGTHAIDALRLALGDPPCRRVLARAGTAFGDHDVEDHLVAILEFGDVLTHIECSYGVAPALGSTATLELFGTAGYARNRPFEAVLSSDGEETHLTHIPEEIGGALPSRQDELFSIQAEYFVERCRVTAHTSLDDLASAVEVVHVVDAVYRSVATATDTVPVPCTAIGREPRS